ncbi:TetR/AcrR family transcriptional regulator [Vibrio sp. ZSDZ65]|uniref:TetR/AcrR family transcriptional regulator n=1 Tax=Vibrio qingdaonensis TaxID=2829491 RepID=A0A9X3HXN0_9VIBR|nr:TetR/AcrR family transcriptional regulator [Vibrio qingdaonensis]MCW8347494.1 TetR/AcrR family transcriptional regulator [Vibrio qingdaonensis]
MNRRKKLRIISDAIACASREVGYNNLTVPRIAEKSGMTPSNLYVYFNSKKDMLNYAQSDIENRLIVAILRPHKDLDNSIHSACTNLFHYLLDYPDHFMYLKQRNNINAYSLINGEITTAKIRLVGMLSIAAKASKTTTETLSCLLFSPIIDLATIAHTTNSQSHDDIISLIVDRAS